MTESVAPASPFAGRHVLQIVAHQDDEVLGAGAQYPFFGRLSLLHVTDGAGFAPEARAKRFASLKDYAAARTREMRDAVAEAKVPAEFHSLGIRCLEASFRLNRITAQVARAITRMSPDIVLTHSYEGGHPDHDAVAFAVQKAVQRLPRAVPVWEFAGYHRERDDMVRGIFAPGGPPPLCLTLTEGQRELKRRMLDRFTSQLDVVAQFPLEAEWFRPAPAYDFSQPPLPRPLGYELEGWGMPATLWLAAARRALRTETGWRTAARLRWEMWTRRFHPDRPNVVRLMRGVPLLGQQAW